VRVSAVSGKAHEIRTRFFHECFKLCSYYKHSNLLVARLTYWTIQVQSTHLVGPRTEISIHVRVCGR